MNNRKITTIVALFLFWGSIYGQYNPIVVPADSKISDIFPSSVRYMYPQFVEGEIVLQNGLSSTYMINYNMFHDEIEFINNNDTLTIGRKRELEYAIAESDTFIYAPGYMKFIYGQKLKVYCKDKFYLKEILKRGAMGAVNRTAAIASYSYVDDLAAISYNLVVSDDHVFKREIAYYIATSNGAFEPIKKKNILKLFSFQKDEVKKYLKANKINFEKQEDVIKFAKFLETLI